jgi:hypothetical protein
MKMKTVATLLGLLLAAAWCEAAGLTRDDVLKMVKAGVNEDAIVQAIESSKTDFKLTDKDMEDLQKEGVTDRVLAAMQRKPETVTQMPGGRSYVGGVSDQVVRAEQVVRAIPVAPPVRYFYAPPPPPPPVVYYSPPPVVFGFGFGFGHHHHHHRHCW